MSYELLIGLALIALAIIAFALILRRHPDLEKQVIGDRPGWQAAVDALQDALPTRADVERMIAEAKGAAVNVNAGTNAQTVPVDHVVLDPVTAALGAAVVKAYIDSALAGTLPKGAAVLAPSDVTLLLATLGGPNVRADAQRYAAGYAGAGRTTTGTPS